jgi:prepilin-type N-terminal cleavage/methylation domain-containing protein
MTKVREKSMRGFTIIELLLVVAILGIVAAALVPKLGGLMRSAQAVTSARSIAQLGRYARTMALSNQMAVELVLDLNSATIRTEGVSRLSTGGEGTAQMAEEISIERVLENVQLAFAGYLDRADGGMEREEEGVVRIRYRANGTCRPHRIDVRGKDSDEAYSIEVDMVGLPKIEQRKWGR